MRAGFAVVIAAAALILAARGTSADPMTAPGAAPAGATPAGLWQATDSDTKQPTGWFLITDHDGVYDGIIAKMFLKPGEDPNVVCDQCKDDRHDQRWLGLEIIRGMKREDDTSKYSGGSILDPRDGKIYHAIMKLSPDGQTLTVRGYIGIELLGENQYWTRLPSSAYTMLDPSVNPNPAVNPRMVPPKHPPAHRSQMMTPQNAAHR
ncbi:MAG TPA: DUF2147 domain-containing protein [Xanthobacteraceae bacterium]|nr:DUF2147 domain-containing protein [Xanthobacteraceae bacterium]